MVLRGKQVENFQPVVWYYFRVKRYRGGMPVSPSSLIKGNIFNNYKLYVIGIQLFADAEYVCILNYSCL